MAALTDGLLQGVVLGSGAIVVWALALYVATRAPGRRAPALAASAMLCLAIYLLGQALGALAPDIQTWAQWLRRTWWAPSLALPIWLVLTLTLAADEGPRPWAGRVTRALPLVAVVAIGLGLVLGVVGTASTHVQEWDTPVTLPSGARHAPAAELLTAFQVYTLICLLWSAANLGLLWHTSPRGAPLRARFGWLSASAALFLLGGAWVTVASGVYLQPGLPGQLLLIAGMLILGWNMARYGALLAGEQVLTDFVAYAAAMLAIVIVYGIVLLTLAPDYGWIERGLPLLLLVMTTHVLVDTRGHLLDRLIYAPMLSRLHGQLRDLGNRVVRQPDELTALADVRETVDQILRERSPETDLRVLVEGALRHLNDLPTLAEHPLLSELPGLAELSGTPLERAAQLRNALDQAIERLRPSGVRPTPGTSVLGGWLHYLVLKEAYVDGRPNKQVMQRYALSEGTFHRARRRAIDAIASDVASRGRVSQALYQ